MFGRVLFGFNIYHFGFSTKKNRFGNLFLLCVNLLGNFRTKNNFHIKIMLPDDAI